MIYLHCGWPKTGTTSLQAALAEYRYALARAGIVYPDLWHRGGDDSHNLLSDVLGGAEGDRVRAQFMEVPEAHAGTVVLLSAESLTIELFEEKTLEKWLGLLRDIPLSLGLDAIDDGDLERLALQLAAASP